MGYTIGPGPMAMPQRKQNMLFPDINFCNINPARIGVVELKVQS